MSYVETESDLNSSDSLSTSKSSSECDSYDVDIELAKVSDVTLRLPKQLCEDPNIFSEFFSFQTWKELPNNFQAYLKNKFLPDFPELNDNEQELTLKMLFNDQIECFNTTPLRTFRRTLEDGGYRPDLIKLRSTMRRFLRREKRFQESERLSKLSKSLLISREKLLRSVYEFPPKCEMLGKEFYSHSGTPNYSVVRANKRFLHEMEEVAMFAGVDHHCNDGIFESLDLNMHDQMEQFNCNSENKIMGTMTNRNEAKYLLLSEKTVFNNSNLRDILVAHKKRKLEEPFRPEFETNDIRLRDVHARTQMLGNYRKINHKKKSKRNLQMSKNEKTITQSFQEVNSIPDLNVPLIKSDGSPIGCEMPLRDTSYENESQTAHVQPMRSDLNITKSDSQTKTSLEAILGSDTNQKEAVLNQLSNQSHSELLEKTVTKNQTSDLQAVPHMPLSVKMYDAGHEDLQNDLNYCNENLELTQGTHVCFLSLLRDVFCSTLNHRIKLDDLRERVASWLSNPISALNDWYNNAENWSNLIPSAIRFLAGDFFNQPDDFVPYLEFKPHLEMYQWIGAGRDSDQHLLQLYNYWLTRRHEIGTKLTEKCGKVALNAEDKDDISFLEKPGSPPPPKCPTSWIVQPYSAQEIVKFRIQEKTRFENPHRAFTYKMHDYESVVGPVKGIYTQIFALTKARGHNMLIAERPNYVTILTLVRDATARLPNGEGTRADICELLKSSQYLNPQAQESILQTIVSGALDRMHTEHDPCVRYDAKRKIWIYLHRNRTEEEFELLHQQFQGLSKHKKVGSRKIKQKVAKSANDTFTYKITDNSETLSNIQTSFNAFQKAPANSRKPVKVSVNVKTDDAVSSDTMAPATLTSVNIDKRESIDKDSLPTLLHQPSTMQTLPNLIIDADTQDPACQTFTDGTLLDVVTSVVNIATNTAPLITNVYTKPAPTKPNFIDFSLIRSGNNLHVPISEKNVNQIAASEANPGINILKPTASVLAHCSSLSSNKTIAPIDAQNRTGVTQCVTQNSAKQFLRVSSTTTQSGKSLINPHIAAANISIQQQQKLLASSNTNHQNQQKIAVGGNVNFTSNRPIQKTLSVNFTKANLPSNFLHKKPDNETSNASSNCQIDSCSLQSALLAGTNTFSQNSVQSKQVIISSQGGIQQFHKVFLTSVASSTPSSTIAINTSISRSPITVNSTATNPQVFRLQQAGQLPGTKFHTVNSQNVSQPESTVLSSCKKPQKVQPLQTSHQQPVIIKQMSLLHQIQKHTQRSTSNPQPNAVTVSSTSKATPTTLTAIKTTPNFAVTQTLVSQQAGSQVKHDGGPPSEHLGKPQQNVTRVIKATASVVNSHLGTQAGSLRTQSTMPLLAKVVANNPGQILTLENLLQKQNPGGAIRITDLKPNQNNVLQLGSNAAQLTQYTVVPHGRNIISVATPSRLNTTHANSSGPITNLRPIVAGKRAECGVNTLVAGKNQPQTQMISKVITSNQINSITTHQLMNAKVISKANPGGVRMLNASNLNIAHIRGKPVIIASKPTTVPGQTGVVLEHSISNPNMVISSTPLKFQGSVITPANVQVLSQATSSPAQTVVLGNQIIKVQQAISLKPQVAASTANAVVNNASHLKPAGTKTILLGSTGQTIRMQPSNSIKVPTSSRPAHAQSLVLGNAIKETTIKTANTNQQRVVLAVQGGGQILLPTNFQGGTVNLKSVQGLKVVSVTHHPNKDDSDETSIFPQVLSSPRGSKTDD